MAELNTTSIQSALSNLSLSDFSWVEYYTAIKPLLIFIIAMVIYSIFIFKFYRFLAKRDLITLKLDKYAKGFTGFLKKGAQITFHILETVILTPIISFFWFAILAILLLVITKTHTAESLLLTSAAIIASVRVTSYYNEHLSQDLAKMIPFALLGIFIVDMSYFTIQGTIDVALGLPSLWKVALYYLLLIIIIEIFMRILTGTINLIRGKSLMAHIGEEEDNDKKDKDDS